METIYIYLIKCFGLIVIFYLTYHFLLRKETFFNSNRWFLLAGLFTSVLLPLLFFNKIIWISPIENQTDWSNSPATPILENETYEINWFLIVGVIYSIGLLAFLIQFSLDFFSLTKVIKGKNIQQQADFKFIDIKQNISPFSYFNYIVYNSDLYSANELENILEHEKVHSAQNHTIDVLIARLFCIIFWFNPFIWLYKNAMLQNLEFIADSEATKSIPDKTAYQITLLKITTHENCVEITNHFYQSLIKKRIVMLNKNQSKKWNSWKYAIVLPVLVAFVFLFQIKVIAQEKVLVIKTEQKTSNQQVIVVIDKNASDASLKQDAANLKADYGITLTISKVKRNSTGEITGIKVAFKDEQGNSGVNQVNGNKPIQPITFIKNIDEKGKGEIGFYTNNNPDLAVNISKEDFLENTAQIEMAESPESPEEIQKVIITKDLNGAESPTIYINGELVDINSEKFADLDPKNIKIIKVDKRNRVNQQYGITNKNGVISITSDEEFIKSAQEMEQAQIELEQARIEMESQRPEIERARVEMESAKPEFEKAQAEMKAAMIEMQKAKIEMDKAKAELIKAKAEIQKKK